MHTRSIHLLLAAAIVGFSLTAGTAAAAPPSPTAPGPASLPRDLEMELALSALPPHLRDQATVYVLNPLKGFERVRKGTNGFHAFVARTGDDAFRGSWPLKSYRDDILYPVSFDSAGAEAFIPVFFDAAEMQAKGVPSQELKTIIKERYATNYYKAPARAGISYMLSPMFRTYTSPDEHEEVATVNFPHVMHYAPNVSATDIGGARPGSPYPFLIHQGPHGYSIQGVGDTQRQAINMEYTGLLTRLCELRAIWCLPGEVTVGTGATHKH